MVKSAKLENSSLTEGKKVNEEVLNRGEKSKQGSFAVLFVPLFLTVFLILFVSFLQARSLLQQVVGGELFYRLERSLFLTHFSLLLIGLLTILICVRCFLRNKQS
ncbi:MAG: hypothetical protein HY582_00020 [Candidatus Omnitrophica bacterium]|nr:hypothetical protein [Candidatus Omnitrophota bacterium]